MSVVVVVVVGVGRQRKMSWKKSSGCVCFEDWRCYDDRRLLRRQNRWKIDSKGRGMLQQRMKLGSMGCEPWL